MSRLGLFVREARTWLALKEPVIFVVGNESCDLDSAVSAIGLAYLYMVTTTLPVRFLIFKRRFVPVLNIQRNNLPLKTEVTHYMRKHGIDIDDLVCRDDVTPELLNTSRVILVDHHVPTFGSTDQILSIFDHRPLDSKNANFSSDCNVKLNEVGSCATLIANEIRVLNQSLEDQRELISFLRGAIVLDTVNFSEAAEKAKPLDIEINGEIEKILNLTQADRLKLFDEMIKARSDVSSLSTIQLLSKDLKFLSNNDKSYVVAFPGFPLLVEDYIRKENALDSLKEFGTEHDCSLLVLIGLKQLECGGIRRDIGLFPLRDSDITTQLINALSIEHRDYFQFERKCSDIISSAQGYLFEQKNLKASRKQIMPIIQKILDR